MDDPRYPGPGALLHRYGILSSWKLLERPRSDFNCPFEGIYSSSVSIVIQSFTLYSFFISVSCVNVGHTLLETRMVVKKEVTQRRLQPGVSLLHMAYMLFVRP